MKVRDTGLVYAESIVNTIREALLVLDQELRVISASRSFYRQFRVTPEETEGRLIYELGNHQWDIPQLRDLLEAIIPGQTTIEGFEVKHRFEGIGEKVMLLNARRLERDVNESGLILLAIEDITLQYVTRQKLSESEAKYHKFVEDINSIIIGFDRYGKITFFNFFSEKLFGYSRSEVIGKTFVGTIIPCVDSKGADNSRICQEIFTDPQKYYANESEGVCRDGRRIVFTWSTKAVRDSSGEVTEILIDGNDVTELSAAQKKLEENSAQLKNERDFVTAVIQTSGAVITVIDMDGKITRFNKACEELTGYTEDEVIGQSVFALFIPPEEREKVVSVAARLFAGERWVDFENHWITRSGERRFIRWRNSNLLDDNGTPILAVATGIDITDRKKAEDALQSRTDELIAANQDLESFSFSVSHDLRTPLTAIKGFSDIFMKDYGDKLDKDGRSILDHIIAATDKMDSIITDLLSLSRISKEKMNCLDIDLSQVAHSVINEFRETGPHRNVTVNIAPALHVWADPGFMNITLTNLIGNAWKYTGNNPEAHIDIGSTTIENKNVYFVRDNGAGFDMNLAGKLFKPFQRLHSDKQFKGTGIGLAIVQRIIHRHGGTIWAESQPDKGTVFYFTLPGCTQQDPILPLTPET